MKSLKVAIFDLDGTIYRGDEQVPGAGDFVNLCAANGIRRLFVTNRSNRSHETISEQIRGFGVQCSPDEVITTGDATARYLGAGCSVYCVGEQALSDSLESHGLRITRDRPDAVVVSLDRYFTYEKMAIANAAIRAGARFIATNMDNQLKTDRGLMPGTGSIVEAIAAASATRPEVVGKPEPLLFRMALDAVGAEADEAIAIGDNIATDIGAGIRANVPTVLLLTGISSRADAEAPDAPKPTYIEESFASLAATFRRLGLLK